MSPPSPEQPRLRTVAEAAPRLRVDERTTRRRCADGSIPGARKLGAKWLIPEVTLAAFEAGEIQPVPQAPAKPARSASIEKALRNAQRTGRRKAA